MIGVCEFMNSLILAQSYMGLVSFPDIIWHVYRFPHAIVKVIYAGVGFGSCTETNMGPEIRTSLY